MEDSSAQSLAPTSVQNGSSIDPYTILQSICQSINLEAYESYKLFETLLSVTAQGEQLPFAEDHDKTYCLSILAACAIFGTLLSADHLNRSLDVVSLVESAHINLKDFIFGMKFIVPLCSDLQSTSSEIVLSRLNMQIFLSSILGMRFSELFRIPVFVPVNNPKDKEFWWLLFITMRRVLLSPNDQLDLSQSYHLLLASGIIILVQTRSHSQEMEAVVALSEMTGRQSESLEETYIAQLVSDPSFSSQDIKLHKISQFVKLINKSLLQMTQRGEIFATIHSDITEDIKIKMLEEHFTANKERLAAFYRSHAQPFPLNEEPFSKTEWIKDYVSKGGSYLNSNTIEKSAQTSLISAASALLNVSSSSTLPSNSSSNSNPASIFSRPSAIVTSLPPFSPQTKRSRATPYAPTPLAIAANTPSRALREVSELTAWLECVVSKLSNVPMKCSTLVNLSKTMRQNPIEVIDQLLHKIWDQVVKAIQNDYSSPQNRLGTQTHRARVQRSQNNPKSAARSLFESLDSALSYEANAKQLHNSLPTDLIRTGETCSSLLKHPSRSSNQKHESKNEDSKDHILSTCEADWNLVVKLYLYSIEMFLQSLESSENFTNQAQKLVCQKNFHLPLITCAMAATSHIRHNSHFSFDNALRLLQVSPFDVVLIIRPLCKNVKFPETILTHLREIEEKCLHIRVWEAQSDLWNFISQHSPDKLEQLTNELYTNTSHSNERKLSIFFDAVLRLAFLSLRILVDDKAVKQELVAAELQSDAIIDKSLNLFKHCLSAQYDLFRGKQFGHVLTCCLYFVCKANAKQASIQIFRPILYSFLNNFGKRLNLPNVKVVNYEQNGSPRTMQVIDWYNNAFLPKVKTKLIDVIITSSEFVQERDKSEKEAIRIVEEAGSKVGESCISQAIRFPKSRNASSVSMLASAYSPAHKHTDFCLSPAANRFGNTSLFISPRRVTKSPIGNTTTRAIYSFGESPSSDLKIINQAFKTRIQSSPIRVHNPSYAEILNQESKIDEYFGTSDPESLDDVAHSDETVGTKAKSRSDTQNVRSSKRAKKS